MAIDAEIEAAVVAIRAIRVKGAKVHEEVMRAYARAAVEAAEQARKDDFQRRAQLNNKPTAPTAEGARSGDAPNRTWPRCLKRCCTGTPKNSRAEGETWGKRRDERPLNLLRPCTTNGQKARSDSFGPPRSPGLRCAER